MFLILLCFFCVKLKISITTELIRFFILGISFLDLSGFKLIFLPLSALLNTEPLDIRGAADIPIKL